MGLWRFMDYCPPAGNNLIEEWYWDLPDEAQAEFDVTLKVLSVVEDWRTLSEFKSLGRDGLCEIRFKARNIQYRPAGFFGPGVKRFSIYVGCMKKGRVFEPPNAFDLAIKRRGMVLRRGRHTCMSELFKLWQKLSRSKKYRESFAASVVKRLIPLQIRVLRKQRDWSQAQLAKESVLTQGVISRAEDPDYGNLTINTLVRIGAGFDCAFVGHFIPFSELGRWYTALVDENSLRVPSFADDVYSADRKPVGQAYTFDLDYSTVPPDPIVGSGSFKLAHYPMSAPVPMSLIEGTKNIDSAYKQKMVIINSEKLYA